jgi:peptidoglycan/xylan/chitin deacetylase (PgdA/CDA1 family)
MKKKWLIAAVTAVVLLCVGGLAVSLGGSSVNGAKASDSDTTEKSKSVNGLQKTDGAYYYYVKGKAVTDTYRKVNVNGVNYYYYFQSDGSAFTGGYRKVTYKGDTFYCYFQKNGRAYTGGLKKVSINGVNYYFYFNKNGRAVTDQLKKVTTSSGDTAYYFFRSNGRAAMNCFKEVDGKMYYFRENGQACVGGKHKISHYMCYFGEDGALTRRIDINKKMIALTYDDGPSKYTSELLDVMEKYNTVCTFFIVGNRVSTYADTVRREAELGCELGNHTYDHELLDTLDSDEEIVEQIENCNDAVEEASGIRPSLLRSPGGRRTDEIDLLMGMPNILWSVDTLDWKTKDTEATIQAVKDDAKDGAIILMHDLHESTCDAAESVVTYLLGEGYQLVTVSEMADCRGVELVDGQRYYSMSPQ